MSASSTPHLPVLSWLPQDKPLLSKWELPNPQYFGRRDIALLLRLCQRMCSFPPLPGRIRLEPRCPKWPWAMGRGCTGSQEPRTILLEALFAENCVHSAAPYEALLLLPVSLPFSLPTFGTKAIKGLPSLSASTQHWDVHPHAALSMQCHRIFILLFFRAKQH